MIEICIRIKDDSKSFTHKELVYDTVALSYDDPTLKELIKQANQEINAEMVDPEITITAKMLWLMS